MKELLFFLLGALVVAIVWWLANKATKHAEPPDFDNESTGTSGQRFNLKGVIYEAGN